MGISLRFPRKILYKHCAVVNSDLWAGPKPQTICIETVVLEIRYLGEAEVVFTCPINYSDFPFHVATCRLRVTSFTSVNTSMQVKYTGRVHLYCTDHTFMQFLNNLSPWPPGQVTSKPFWMSVQCVKMISCAIKWISFLLFQLLDGAKIRGYTVNVSYLTGPVHDQNLNPY